MKNIWFIFEKILYGVFSFLFGLMGKEISHEKWQNFMQFVKFCFIGVSNTIVSYVINIVSLYILIQLGAFPKYDYYVANIIAFVLSVLWSFYWNNKFVFKSGEVSRGQLLYMLMKTYIAYAFTGIILSNVLSYVWVEMLHISKYIAPLINSIIGVPINFVINKCWAFKHS